MERDDRKVLHVVVTEVDPIMGQHKELSIFGERTSTVGITSDILKSKFPLWKSLHISMRKCF